MKLKRILALALAIVLVLGMFPAQALAAENGDKNQKSLLETLATIFTGEKDQPGETPAYTCGLEEHTHTDDCLGKEAVCGKQEEEGHTHGEGCYGTEKTELTCTLSTEGHAHTDECKKTLACTLEENHAHSAEGGCYQMEEKTVCETQENHVHTAEAGCFKAEVQTVCEIPGNHIHSVEEKCFEMVCGSTAEDHVHDETCETLVPAKKLICEIEGDHVHEDACYALKEAVCTIPENHTHADACFVSTVSETPQCTIPENHTHGEGCTGLVATETLICTKAENHTHGDSCYTIGEKALCGQEEVAPHTHDPETCYTFPLTCTAEITEGHTHVKECYEVACGLEEHAHTEECTKPKCTCTPDEEGNHGEDCPLYVNPNCNCDTETDKHGRYCPEHTCEECGVKQGHSEDCEFYVDLSCPECGLEGEHETDCSRYVVPAEFGENPAFAGVGPLLGGLSKVQYTEDTDVVLVSPNGVTSGKAKNLLRTSSTAKKSSAVNTEEVDPNNKDSVTAESHDKNVTASKSVKEYAVMEDGTQIFQINMKSETKSITTGESCDFVMVLDMSYSMTGANLAALKEACKTFVNDLYTMSKYSRVAIVTYGGDRNANKYYIRSSKGAAYLTAVAGAQARVYSKYSDNNKLRQQWTLEQAGNGYVRIVNDHLGQALTANVSGTLAHKTWPAVITRKSQNTAAEHWKLVTMDGNTMFQSKITCADKHVTYLDLQSGNTADGSGIGMWETAGSPTQWVLEPVSTTPDYETYYWTDSTNSKGYSYRTAHSAADSAFLVISQDKGEKVNQKLLDAIDALTVYGQPTEGSHPGEAMEKATRIYHAVRYDDDNDICEFTGEHYYDKKRGVLYFADGTPSPTDEKQLTYYPDNNKLGLNYYGVEYDFEETYRDAQDASNWSIVLKFAKGKQVTNNMSAYFINSYGRHEKSEYYDIGSTSKVTGCGATVYVLGTNLPTMNVGYSNCAKKHPGACVETKGVLDGKGNTVSVCYTQVYWRDGGLFDSYDSRSNEFFYRLSSHRPDGTHITAGVSMTDAERIWLEKLFNSEYCSAGSTPVSAWNGRYPDMICRNQTQSYFVACDDQEAIKEAFKGVAQQTGKTLSQLKMRDYITEYYEICDENGNPLTAGSKIPGNPYEGTVYVDEKGRQYIQWDDIELNPGDGTEAGNKKFDEIFYVVPKDAFLGGNHVATNDGAQLLDKDGNLVVDFAKDPEVDVVVKADTTIGSELNARAGTSFLEHVTIDQLKALVDAVAVQGDVRIDLDLSKENFGLEAWQYDFVNIKYEFLDSNKQPLAPDAQYDIRQDRTFYLRMWIWPKTDEAGNEIPFEKVAQDYSECEIEIVVYYPTFVFDDVSLYHGQPLELVTHVWGDAIEATKYLYWYTNEEFASDLLRDPKRTDTYPGYEALLEGSYGKGEGVVAEAEVPHVYFAVDPIDMTIDDKDKTEPVDKGFNDKFGGEMGKEPVNMNVRVYFTNNEDPVYDPDNPQNPMRNAFFLHAMDPRFTGPIRKHTSGSSTNDEMYWLPEFVINPEYCELTVKKTGGLPNETYVFNILRGDTAEYIKSTGAKVREESEPTYYTSVYVTTDANGNGSVTLKELPVGVYQVEEDLNWSWRFGTQPTLSWAYQNGKAGTGDKIYLYGNAEQDTATVTLTNSNPVQQWLSGMSAVVENIYGKTTTE